MKKLALLFCLIAVHLLAKNAEAQIIPVQKTAKDCGTATSCQISLPSPLGAADLLVVGVRLGNANATATLSDSSGNVFSLAKQQVQTPSGDSGAVGAILYAPNVRGGADTITVAQSLSATLRLVVAEYKGVMSTNPLDATASTQGSSALASAGVVTTSAAGDLVVGVGFAADSVSFSPGAGFTVEAATGNKIALEDTIQSSAGSLGVSMSVSPSDRWGALAAAFLAQPAGPPSATVSSIAVTCSPASLLAGGSSNCSAAVSGTGAYSSAVTWKSSAGSISSSGVLAAPAVAGTVVVTAASVQTPSVSGAFNVTVTAPPPPISLAIISPVTNTTQSGVFSVTAQANDNAAVASLQWSMDGKPAGNPQTKAPFVLLVDTATLSTGQHILSAAATDAAGNVGTATISFTVAGQLFDILLLYDDGTPYDPGGTVAVSELLSDGVTTQTDGTPSISQTGEMKFRWTVTANTVYFIAVEDASGNVLWHTGTQLTPQVQAQLTYLGSTATLTFAKATGAWSSIQFKVNYQ